VRRFVVEARHTVMKGMQYRTARNVLCGVLISFPILLALYYAFSFDGLFAGPTSSYRKEAAYLQQQVDILQAGLEAIANAPISDSVKDSKIMEICASYVYDDIRECPPYRYLYTVVLSRANQPKMVLLQSIWSP